MRPCGPPLTTTGNRVSAVCVGHGRLYTPLARSPSSLLNDRNSLSVLRSGLDPTVHRGALRVSRLEEGRVSPCPVYVRTRVY